MQRSMYRAGCARRVWRQHGCTGGRGGGAVVDVDIDAGVCVLPPVEILAGNRNIGGLRILAAIGGATTVEGDGEVLNDLG